LAELKRQGLLTRTPTPQRGAFKAEDPLEEIAAHLRDRGLLEPDSIDPDLGLKCLSGSASWRLPTSRPDLFVRVSVSARQDVWMVTVEATGPRPEPGVRPVVVRRKGRTAEPQLPADAAQFVYRVACDLHEFLTEHYSDVVWLDPQDRQVDEPFEPAG
jgi:hypothetical protein